MADKWYVHWRQKNKERQGTKENHTRPFDNEAEAYAKERELKQRSDVTSVWVQEPGT